MKFTRWLGTVLVSLALIAGGFFLFNRPTVSETVSTEGLCGLYWEEKSPAQKESFYFYIRPTAKDALWHLSGSCYDFSGEFVPFEDTVISLDTWTAVEALAKNNSYEKAERSSRGETTVFFKLYYADGSSIDTTPPESETCTELYRLFTEAAGIATP